MRSFNSIVCHFCFAAVTAYGLIWTTCSAAETSGAAVLSWHGQANRNGNLIVPGLTFERARGLRADPAFHAQLSGHVYAQPLYWRGAVIAATEDDVVQALDGKTGREVWRRALGMPVARGALSCGDIDPLGVTGTPVIFTAEQMSGTRRFQTLIATRDRLYVATDGRIYAFVF